MMFCKQETAMLFLYAAAGLAMSCIWPGIAHTTIAINRNSSGKIMSYLSFGAGLGNVVLPFAQGAIISIVNPMAAFFVLAVLTVAIAIYVLRFSGIAKKIEFNQAK